MVTSAGEDSLAATKRLTIRWGVIFGVLLLAFAGTIVTLNSTLYSATGFVSSYLGSLARNDVDAALAMPGVELPADALPDLLVADALGPLSSYELVSDEAAGAEHTLRFAVQFAGDIQKEVEFWVEHTGPRLGLFSGWQFSRSPVGVLEATPRNAADFEVNGVAVTSTGANQPARFQVLTPGVYSLTHKSKYLEGARTTFLAENSAWVTEAFVDIYASEAFVEQVNTELAEYLDDCATQQVLLPTDCPFGKHMSNRIEGLPEWSISAYPQVSILPSPDEPGTWVVPPTPAAAHLKVDVRSLFDGSLSTFDEDVPFDVSYTVTFPGDGSLLITPR